jgi:putative peptidoglycan lipid II flippase
VPGKTGVARAALLITAGGLASRVLGLFREQLAAGYFGTGDDVAAFQIADNVQTLLFDLVVSGMLQAALVPVLVMFAATSDRRQLRRVSGAIATVAVLIVGVACIIGWLFTSDIVRVMTSLGAEDPARSDATVALTEDLVRIVLPGVLFLALGTVLSAVLYSLNEPAGPATALAARNLVIVVAIVVLAGVLGVKSMAVGVLIGGALVAAIQVPWLVRLKALPIPNLGLRDPAVRQIGRLYLPVFLGLIVSTVQVVIDRNLAWRAEADALGAMRYATTLVQSVLGLVAAAISLAALPVLATHYSNRDEGQFEEMLLHAFRLVTVLILPAVLTLAVLARPVTRLLFEHGETGPSEARSIAIVLVAYLPGTLFAAFDQILIYAYYARRSTWIPVLVGVGAVGAYFVVAAALSDRYGAAGLAIANSVQFIAHTLILGWLFRGRLAGMMARYLPALAWAIAGAVACAAAAFVTAWVVRQTTSGLIDQFGAVVMPIAVGGLVYAVVITRSGIDEVSLITDRLLSRLPGRRNPAT